MELLGTRNNIKFTKEYSENTPTKHIGNFVKIFVE